MYDVLGDAPACEVTYRSCGFYHGAHNLDLAERGGASGPEDTDILPCFRVQVEGWIGHDEVALAAERVQVNVFVEGPASRMSPSRP